MTNILQKIDQFDWEKAKSSIDAYSESVGVYAGIMNEAGDIVHRSRSLEERTVLCNFFEGICLSASSSAQLYPASGRQIQKTGEVNITGLPGGLVYWTVPFTVNGICKGSLFGGPVYTSEPDEKIIKELLHGARISSKSKMALKEQLYSIKLVENAKIPHYAEMLFIVAADLVQHEMRIYKERRDFYRQQAQLSEAIHNLRGKFDLDQEEDEKGYSAFYPITKEKELIRKVKMGDKVGAKTVLNEILGQVFFANANSLPVIKARILELVVILSRAAVEGGARLEMIMGLNFKYIQEFSRLDDLHELSFWVIKVLEKFTEAVFSIGNVKNYEIIQKALDFMRQNYKQDISLEDVAKAVYLSPGYFSRLFKEEVGLNFSDYLSKIRIEESKKYLSMLSMSLFDVAQEVGYQDQSYYTKVFKKIEGISPGQFRKNNWKDTEIS